VCPTRAQAAAAARALLGERMLGAAGEEIVIEACLEGEELSLLALTDGERVLLLPAAQDHKRLGEGDTGPNTGGMGAYCPVSLATPALCERVRREVIAPVLAALAARGTPYRGVLYAGLMIAPDGSPFVLEFNSRFGDPEAQAVLPLVPGVTRHLVEIATGAWRPDAARLEPLRAAVATVLAAPGYPERPVLGAAIEIPRDLEPGTLVFHAGTGYDPDGTLRVRGGRVLTVTALGATVAEAARKSVAACERIAFPGKTYRRDIGWRERARGGAEAGAGAGAARG
jgi:phosphoribosylamine--glycine ligase